MKCSQTYWLLSAPMSGMVSLTLKRTPLVAGDQQTTNRLSTSHVWTFVRMGVCVHRPPRTRPHHQAVIMTPQLSPMHELMLSFRYSKDFLWQLWFIWLFLVQKEQSIFIIKINVMKMLSTNNSKVNKKKTHKQKTCWNSQSSGITDDSGRSLK